MKPEPRRIISGRHASIKHTVDVVGELNHGDIVKVEIRTEKRLHSLENRLCRFYPHSNFLIETFMVDGVMWAYIYIETQPKSKLKRL